MNSKNKKQSFYASNEEVTFLLIAEKDIWCWDAGTIFKKFLAASLEFVLKAENKVAKYFERHSFELVRLFLELGSKEEEKIKTR